MKISVVTICFNAARDLPRTLESVADQNYKDLEYVIIDGASTDGTLGTIDRHRKFVSKIVSEPDEGISDAINKGIRVSSGEIIGLLHAGDMYEPHTVSTVADFFEQNPDVDVAHGNISYADSSGKILYEQKPDLREGIIWKKMPYHHPTCFVRKSSYEKFGLFDKSYKVAMDYELMLRFYCQGAKFGYIDGKLAVMCLKGLSDRNWRRSISESRRAAIACGRNQILARVTEMGRLLRTTATAVYFRITGKTLRQSFPRFRKQTSPVKAILDSLRVKPQ